MLTPGQLRFFLLIGAAVGVAVVGVLVVTIQDSSAKASADPDECPPTHATETP